MNGPRAANPVSSSEFAHRGVQQLVVADQALGNGPGAGVAPRPIRTAGMRQQHLRLLEPAKCQQSRTDLIAPRHGVSIAEGRPCGRPSTFAMLCGQTASTATIFSVPGSTMTISSPTTKYMKPRHAGWISTRVVGTATTRMLRGTTVPTLSEKLIWLRSIFGRAAGSGSRWCGSWSSARWSAKPPRQCCCRSWLWRSCCSSCSSPDCWSYRSSADQLGRRRRSGLLVSAFGSAVLLLSEPAPVVWLFDLRHPSRRHRAWFLAARAGGLALGLAIGLQLGLGLVGAGLVGTGASEPGLGPCRTGLRRAPGLMSARALLSSIGLAAPEPVVSALPAA